MTENSKNPNAAMASARRAIDSWLLAQGWSGDEARARIEATLTAFYGRPTRTWGVSDAYLAYALMMFEAATGWSTLSFPPEARAETPQ